MDYKSIITNHNEYFVTSNFIHDFFRIILWGLVDILRGLSNGAEAVFNAAYGTLNFTNSSVFKNFLSEFSIFITLVLTISFIATGLMLMFSEKKPPFLRNVFIGLAIIYVAPSIVTALNEGLIATKKDLMSGSYTNQTILSNVSDLKYIANHDFKFDSTLAKTLSGNETAIKALDPSEHVKPSDFDTNLQKQVFNHYLALDSNAGTITWKEMGSKGLFEIFDPPYYYRYYIHYLQIYFMLIANIIVFCFSAYAVIKMIWEIVTTRLISAVMAMELTSGQKTIKVLEAFFDGYIVLFAIPVMLKLYLLWQQYLNTTLSNGIVRTVLMLFGALVVVDGPATIQRIFGYDMGISAGSQKLMGFMRMAQQARMQHHFSKQAKMSKKYAGAGGAAAAAFGRTNQSNIREPEVAENNSNNSHSSNASRGAMVEPDNVGSAAGNTGTSSSGGEPTVNTGSAGNGTVTNVNGGTSGGIGEPTVNKGVAGNGAVTNVNGGTSGGIGEPTVNTGDAGNGATTNINGGTAGGTGEPTVNTGGAGNGAVTNVNGGTSGGIGEPTVNTGSVGSGATTNVNNEASGRTSEPTGNASNTANGKMGNSSIRNNAASNNMKSAIAGATKQNAVNQKSKTAASSNNKTAVRGGNSNNDVNNKSAAGAAVNNSQNEMNVVSDNISSDSNLLNSNLSTSVSMADSSTVQADMKNDIFDSNNVTDSNLSTVISDNNETGNGINNSVSEVSNINSNNGIMNNANSENTASGNISKDTASGMNSTNASSDNKVNTMQSAAKSGNADMKERSGALNATVKNNASLNNAVTGKGQDVFNQKAKTNETLRSNKATSKLPHTDKVSNVSTASKKNSNSSVSSKAKEVTPSSTVNQSVNIHNNPDTFNNIKKDVKGSNQNSSVQKNIINKNMNGGSLIAKRFSTQSLKPEESNSEVSDD